MDNNKINLLPKDQNFNNKRENQTKKSNAENFLMHIPDEQEDRKAKISFFSKLKNIFFKIKK
ncbi:MAG: hypothetical protein ABIC82_01540 [bacterium]